MFAPRTERTHFPNVKANGIQQKSSVPFQVASYSVASNILSKARLTLTISTVSQLLRCISKASTEANIDNKASMGASLRSPPPSRRQPDTYAGTGLGERSFEVKCRLSCGLGLKSLVRRHSY